MLSILTHSWLKIDKHRIVGGFDGWRHKCLQDIYTSHCWLNEIDSTYLLADTNEKDK